MAEPNHDSVLQTKQLQQLLPVLLVLNGGFFSTYLIVFILTRQLAFLVSAIGFFIAGVCLVIARSFLRQERIILTVWLSFGGLCIALLMSVLAFPFAYAALLFGLVALVVITFGYLQGRSLILFLCACWVFALAIVLFRRYVTLFPPPAAEFVLGIELVGTLISIAVLLWLLWQYHQRLTLALSQSLAANMALRAIQANLESEVADRTAALQTALDAVEAQSATQTQLLEELALKSDTIRELSVPVLPISDSTLVMPLVGALDSTRLRQVQEQALHAIETSRARRLLLDITGVPIVDSQVAQGLISVVQAARLLGADVVLVGIRPEVAQAMVQLGLDLQGITTHSQLQQGIAMA